MKQNSVQNIFPFEEKHSLDNFDHLNLSPSVTAPSGQYRNQNLETSQADLQSTEDEDNVVTAWHEYYVTR